MAASSPGGLERKTEVADTRLPSACPVWTVVRGRQFPRRHRTQLLSGREGGRADQGGMG